MQSTGNISAAADAKQPPSLTSLTPKFGVNISRVRPLRLAVPTPRKSANIWRGSPVQTSPRTRSRAPTAGTEPCATTAPTSKRPQAQPRDRQTTRSPPSMTLHPLRPRTGGRRASRRPHRGGLARSTHAPSSATSEPSRPARRHATRRSRWSRSTPARGSARSSPSTSTTSPAPPTKASYEFSAKANKFDRSRSTHYSRPR